MIKAHAVRLFAMVLAFAGFIVAAYFTASIWQDKLPFFPVLNIEAWLPAHPAAAWLLERMHIGALFGALGAAIAAAGILLAIRQTALLRTLRRRREDALRRVRQYRADEARQQLHENRLEPFIGSGTDRRVA